MVLILLAALTAVFSALLWLGTVLLQGWLYNDLPSKVPLRALAGGLLLAAFHTGWCVIYRVDPGRFDTLYSFRTEVLDGTYDEFESIRRVNQTEAPPVRYVRRGASNDFVAADGGRPWTRSDSQGMVVAILIKEHGKSEPTRFEPNLQPDGTFRPREESRFEADRGRRYMDESALGKVYRKRSLPILANLLANSLHLALWIVVLWPILRFTLGHAVGFGFLMWIAVMLLQPGLFGLVTGS